MSSQSTRTWSITLKHKSKQHHISECLYLENCGFRNIWSSYHEAFVMGHKFWFLYVCFHLKVSKFFQQGLRVLELVTFWSRVSVQIKQKALRKCVHFLTSENFPGATPRMNHFKFFPLEFWQVLIYTFSFVE